MNHLKKIKTNPLNAEFNGRFYFFVFHPTKMFKKTLLGLGLVLVIGAAVSMTSASRYVYHQYQRYSGYPNYGTHNHYTAYRPTTNRVYGINYGNRYRNQYKAQCDYRDQYGCHYYNKNVYSYNPNYGYRQNRYALNQHNSEDYKLNRPHLYPRVENTFQSDRLVVRNGNYRDRVINYRGRAKAEEFYPVEAVTYAINHQGFAPDGAGAYRASGTSLAFRVLQTPDRYRCSQSNFWSCAAQANRDFRSVQNLGQIYDHHTDFRWNQTQDLDFAYYPTITESFNSNNAGRNMVYFTFNALNPLDGSLVRIEGVADAREKARASQIMHNVFESFRFRP